MSREPVQFLLPDNWDISRSIDFLTDGLRVNVDNTRESSRTYLDTFDGRLYQNGQVLISEGRGSSAQLVLMDLPETRVLETLPLNGGEPRFAWDMPISSMRSALTPVLEMRALLPRVELTREVTGLRLLDEEQKTVLRIQLEMLSAAEVGRKAQARLGIHLRLLPVKGYDKALDEMKFYLNDQFDLEPSDEVVIDQALASIGRGALDYSSKLDFSFDPASRADLIARQIHLHLLDTVETNLAGTKADTDSEFLHDLRVAIRRSRSALSQIKGVFHEQEVEQFKPLLAWVGQVTGPTRDMDVYLLAFDEYKAALPDQFQADLEPLHHFLVEHQKSAQSVLVRKLNSPHFRKMIKEWRTFLEMPPVDEPTTPKGGKSIRSVADKRIHRMYERVLDEGLSIRDDSAPEMLHELRKSCKKLRYLLEFFQSLYPAKQVKALVKALKGLLNVLGDFQDLEVQADKLRDFAHQMVDEGEVPADTLLAMGMLVDSLLKRQIQARREFAGQFENFASEENRNNYAMLFAKKQPKTKDKA